ncbi:MAG: regulatory protein TetR [Ilumatobacteraceae bacterium]|nr:regulatory protein TetR [Ilumatobacteraceae bacterium]
MDNDHPVNSMRQASPLRSRAVVDARVVRSQESLLNAARQLLVEGGPAAITVDAVAARSGVAKSTLYRHWETRDELVLAVFQSLAPPVIEPDPSLSAADALRAFGRQLAAVAGDPEWQCMMPALLSLKLHQDDYAMIQAQMQDEQRGVINRLLQRCVDEGLLRQDATSDTSFTMLVGPFLMASLTGGIPIDDVFADTVTDHFVQGHRVQISA